MLKRLHNNKKTGQNLPMILVILDGWGLAEPNRGNAISSAKLPTMTGILRKYPSTTLCASGKCVGLPEGQVGNSEAGHMNIGAGRLVLQDDVRITRSIKDGTFFKNAAFVEAIKHVKKRKGAMHLIGMISNGMSPHSNGEHLLSLLEMLKLSGITQVYLHLFTDGRDSPKYSGLKLVQELESKLNNGERVASIMGRYYAMDRTKRWELTEKAYNALTVGEGKKALTSQAAITESYNRGETDEYMEPYLIGKKEIIIKDEDSVIFFNLRSDRARQLAKAFVQEEFNKNNPGAFKRKKTFKNLCFVAMTDFGPDLDGILTVCPGIDIKDTLPMALHDLRQLYIAEREKFAHVTYFFNGGYSGKVNGEDQFMIDSPNVKFYNETPAMSSFALTERVIDNLAKNKYDFTVLNFAAPDMIGHTGDLAAGIKCCEATDECLAKIIGAYAKAGGTVIITADHGNIEEMINLKSGEINTEHSTNSVPFILINNKLKNLKLRDGMLADIAPTILDLLRKEKPTKMRGKSLLEKFKK